MHQVLRLELPDELVVDADGGTLEQTLENLLSNAVKYTPDEGAITFSLDCATSARDSVLGARGDHHRLVIGDRGGGIALRGPDPIRAPREE